MHNLTKAKLAIVGSFGLFLKMLYDLFGLEYLTKTTDEMMSGVVNDIAIGEVLPIDIGTLAIGAIVICLANYGLKNGKHWPKLAKVAKVGAVIIMVLSFTPITPFLSMLPRMLVGVNDDTKIFYSEQDYEELAKYINVSKSIALTDGANKAEIESYLKENLTDAGKQEVQSIIAEEIRDYVEITLKFNDSGKSDLVYSMDIEEVDYPTAYFQMKYSGRTVLGCKEELKYKGKLQFENISIKYPTMMEYAVIGVDTIYANAKGADENTYEYKILVDSTSIYKTLAPYLANDIPSQISALPEYCKEMVYKAANFLPGNGSQTIETSQTLDVNGIQMQRTTGVLTGSEYGANGAITTYRYVAYYFFVEEDGVSYPAVMIAVGNEQIASDVEYYIDQIIQQVKRN